MAVNAYDVQVCVWKILKISSKTCLNVSIQHPYASSTFFVLFLLYISFPFVFWILIYSLPLIVCSCIVLTISFNLRNNAKCKENEDGETGENCGRTTKFTPDQDKSKKPFNRVHSVRRRKAIDIVAEEQVHNNEEEKNEVSSPDFSCDVVDKSTLIVEEDPKEIREVEVDFSLVRNNNSDSLKEENEEGCTRIRRLGILKDEDEDEANKVGRQDDQKNVKEVEILDAERNKRLESLIARRRSRKLLSLQVRRSLMMNRIDHSQIASLMLPKINTFSPHKMGGQLSPGPGSAPSVLIPMRNPFDLPYDPQEEKPVLTGDSFQQEFTSSNYRDIMFCRHESFSLGPSLPSDFFRDDDDDDTSSFRDFGFRQRASSPAFHIGHNFLGRDFSLQKEQEPSASKSNTTSPDDDQIKEIIQVHENNTQNHSDHEVLDNPDESGQIPQSDFYSSSTSPGSSSSEEDQPVFKIDREAILKSLSSMRRNTLLEIDNNDRIGDNNLSYANSALENASRLKQQYYADKPTRRHGVSNSIASDMQVEVSEVSSPPLTIDENMSYEEEMERNMSWDGDEWPGLARSSGPHGHGSTEALHGGINVGESRIERSEDDDQSLTEKHCIESKPSEEIIEVSTAEDEQIDSSEASVSHAATDMNDSHQEQSSGPTVQSSMISPKSVLLPTVLSLSSFDPYIDHEEVHQSEPHIGEVSTPNSTAVIDQTRDLPRTDGDAEFSHISEISSNRSTEESIKPTNASTLEAADTESVKENVKAQENDEQPEQERPENEAQEHKQQPGEETAQEDQEQPKKEAQENDEQTEKVAGNGKLDLVRIDEETKQPREETSSRSFTNTDEVFSRDFEAANSTDISQNIDHSDNFIPLLSAKEELSETMENVVVESKHDDSSKTNDHKDQTENSTLPEETEHDERQTNSTISNVFEETR